VEQSLLGEANSHSFSQKTLHLLRIPMVHYHIYNSLPLVPILSQMNLVHTFSPHFPKIHS